MQNARLGTVDFKTVLIFGIPSIVAVYLTRAFIVPFIPAEVFSVGDYTVTKPILLMLLFAVVMVAASVSMINPSKKNNEEDSEKELSYNYPIILL